jgi:hypothetical protein
VKKPAKAVRKDRFFHAHDAEVAMAVYFSYRAVGGFPASPSCAPYNAGVCVVVEQVFDQLIQIVVHGYWPP